MSQIPAHAPSVFTTNEAALINCALNLIEEKRLKQAPDLCYMPGDSAANLWAATARTNRAPTLLKHASQGNAHGNALNALGRV